MGTTTFADLESRIKEGRFQGALQLLDNDLRHARSADEGLWDAYEAELLFETGQESGAIVTAERRLNKKPAPAIATRLHRILALTCFNLGDLAGCKENMARASASLPAKRKASG